MLYSALITKLRRELRDFETIADQQKWDGDGSLKVFQVAHRPIKAGSYTVEVGGVAKTETTDYAIDKETGILTFVAAPAAGSDNVTIDYSYFQISDDDYIEMINDAIDHFQWKFWKEADDSSTITTVKNQYEYDLSSLTGILYVVQCWYKSSSTATYWGAVQSYTNWKYLTRQQKIYVDPPFTTASLPLKFRYLKSITKGIITTATVDIPDEWIEPYKTYAKGRWFERQIAQKIAETKAVTQHAGYERGPVILNVVEYFDRKADDQAKKIAPRLPTMSIKNIHEGVAM